MLSDLEARCERARQLFKQGKVSEAIDEARALADQRFPPAQVIMGWAYEVGHAGCIDLEEAQSQYAAAAASGEVSGQYLLAGLLLRLGNEVVGREWMEKAAEGGYSPALYQLGKLHSVGIAGQRNIDEALRCFRRAAAAGHPLAQKFIAKRGIRGHDGLLGFVKGLLWFATFVPRFAARIIREGDPDPNVLSR